MEYFHESPKINRSNQDRFLSPIKSKIQRISITPQKSFKENKEQFNSDLLPNSRASFFSKTNNLFNSPRRQSINQKTSNTLNRLPTKPSKVLDIGNIPSDFYLNPIDWSKKDIIALATDTNLIFIHSKSTNNKTFENLPNDIRSIKFNKEGDKILLGLDNGIINLYDINENKILNEFNDLNSTILCINNIDDNNFIIGEKFGNFQFIDIRIQDQNNVYHGHNEEICNIKFSPSTKIFATSSNDCTIKIWDQRNLNFGPITHFQQHEAAVKALEWSPINKDLIISGGGTSDRTLKYWNSNTGEIIKSIPTGSQVCNLFWNQEYNEILSTHGFSQNHLAIWKAPEITHLASYHTHKERVLYLAVSPDGTKVATAAPGDMFYIWNLFPKKSIPLSESLLCIR